MHVNDAKGQGLAGLGPAGGRFARAAGFLVLGWVTLEIAALIVIGERWGWRPIVIAIIVKGGIGLLALGIVVVAHFLRVTRVDSEDSMARIHAARLDMGAAILLALPGLTGALIAPLVFLPGLRRRLIGEIARITPSRESDEELP